MKPIDNLRARMGHDIGDVCDRIWANAAPQHRAGREPSLASRLGPSGDHRISQEHRDGGGNASCGNPPPSNS
jgi:hypothetical protein